MGVVPKANESDDTVGCVSVTVTKVFKKRARELLIVDVIVTKRELGKNAKKMCASYVNGPLSYRTTTAARRYQIL